MAVNGEMGAVFLMTMDGLFLRTLGGEARQLPPRSRVNLKGNEEVKAVTFQQEHFHPTINQTADGAIYLVAGFQQATLPRLEGWGDVRRRDFARLKLTAQDLAGIPPTWTDPARKAGRPTQEVAILRRGPKVDGDLSDWPAGTGWMPIDARASAALAVDGKNLYAAFRTGDPKALDNAGKDYRSLFKNGGALDLMLGTDPKAPRSRSGPVAGDVRLVVTRTDGKTTATLFRAVNPKAAKAAGVLFESPIGKVAFDQVLSISEHVRLVQTKGNCEFSVPLKVLGLQPSPGQEILGDVGVLRGREGRTMQRVYWGNKDTVLVSDLPNEARLYPARWGVLSADFHGA
jgi:hypothetical protein